MTKNEVKEHLEKLLDEGKVYLNNNNKYRYEFTHETGMKYSLGFSPRYYNGELYLMNYPIESSIGYGDSSGYILLMKSFKDNKSNFETFITKDSFGDEIYTNIKDNLIVTFEKTVKPVMIYENAPISKLVKEEEANTKKEQASKSASEF